MCLNCGASGETSRQKIKCCQSKLFIMFKVCTFFSPARYFFSRLKFQQPYHEPPMLRRGTPRLHALLTVNILWFSTWYFLEHEFACHCRALNSQTELPGDDTTLKQLSFLFCKFRLHTLLIGRYLNLHFACQLPLRESAMLTI
jgi:hypothetical protein